jgi:hypothetical protein
MADRGATSGALSPYIVRIVLKDEGKKAAAT